MNDSTMVESASYKQIWRITTRPMLLQQTEPAFDIARRFYAQFSDMNFEADLMYYLRHGFVIARPHLFCMVRPVQHEGVNAWFIGLIVGNLLEAISCLPCVLPKMIFCRDNDKMRVVNTERFIRVALMMAKLNEKRKAA